MSSDRSHSSGYSLPLVAFGAFFVTLLSALNPPPKKIEAWYIPLQSQAFAY